MKLAALFTGGKDSVYAIHLAKKQGHEIVCLISIISKNPDSYMFHTPAIELTKLQAEALQLPILLGTTEGIKEAELVDLEKTIITAKEKFEFEGLLTGALFSEYQSSRIETIAKKLNLQAFSPHWQKPQEQHMEELINENFKIIFTAIAAEGLNKDWLNKIITKDELEKLKVLHQEIGFHIAGEGGEFESLVLDCPLFKKKLTLSEFEIVMDSEFSGRMIIKKAELEEKRNTK